MKVSSSHAHRSYWLRYHRILPGGARARQRTIGRDFISASMAAAVGVTRVMISRRRVRQRETIGSQALPQAAPSEPIYRPAGFSWALKEI